MGGTALNRVASEIINLGYSFANLLFDEKAEEDTLRKATLFVWRHLPRAAAILQCSLFLKDQNGIYREIAYVQEGQIFLDTNFIAEQQLPETWASDLSMVRVQTATAYEIWLPFDGNGLIGFMIWSSSGPITLFSDDEFMRFHRIASLGIRHHVAMRQTAERLRLLQATTDLSHRIASTDNTDQILINLVEAGVGVLGFDRTTLFVLDADGSSVSRAIFFGIGTQTPMSLVPAPTPPTLSSEPTHMPDIPAIWAPIIIDGQRIAGLQLDNLYSHDEIPEGALQAVVDVTAQVSLALQKATLVELLNHKASLDDLTGLYRVDYFYDEGNKLIAAGCTEQHATGLIIIDLDDFKQVNDTYGHPAGDAVLMHTASVIRSCLHGGAIAGRIGGDEFVILAPGHNLADSLKLGRHLLDVFSATNFAFVPPNHQRLTISVGVAAAPTDGLSVGDLIQIADKALYQSKRNGKAKVSANADTA